MADAKADANPHGKLHDSRGGFKIFYRYQPRPIQDRCVEKKAKIRLHTSVLDRMEMRTAGYTPGNLPEPGQLEVVFTGPENFPSSPKAEQRAEYTRVRAGLARLRKSRIMLVLDVPVEHGDFGWGVRFRVAVSARALTS